MLAVPYIVPLTNMAMTGGFQQFFRVFEKLFPGSVYTVVAITVERYTTLRQIHKVKSEQKMILKIYLFHSPQ